MCKSRRMWIWAWIFKGASKTPTRQKKSPNCVDDAPVRGARVRATYGSIINTIGLTFLPSCGLLPAKNSEKQCKMYYSHGLAWVMHSEPFACQSCSTGAANAGSWSDKYCPQHGFSAFC